MTTNAGTTTLTILAISVVLVALLAAHREQNFKIRELSRQLSDVLDDDASPRSRRAEELPEAFTYAADFGVVGDSKANDGPGKRNEALCIIKTYHTTHII